MTKNTKRIIYISLISLLFIYLFGINRVLVSLDKEKSEYIKIQNLEKDNVSQIYKSKNPVFYSLEHRYVNENRASNPLILSGWSFSETKNDNTDKQIKILLKGKKNSYLINSSVQFRDDVFRYFQNNKKIKGNKHGFSIEMPTLCLKNDIYQILIYDYENEENYGLAHTGITYIKDRKGFREYVPQPIKNIDNYKLVDNMVFSFILNDENQTSLDYIGSAYMPEFSKQEILNSEIFIEFANKDTNEIQTFETSRTQRLDLKEKANSAYSLSIPVSEIDNGEYNVSIIIELNDLYYKTSAPLNISI